MKTFAIAAAAAACTLALPAAAQERDYSPESDAALAELVEDRVAGEPQSCINVFTSQRLRVVENVGLVYERGDTLWVARARNADDIGVWDIPIIERFGSQLCRQDARRTIDRTTGIFSGVLFLDDFVPYREIDEG